MIEETSDYEWRRRREIRFGLVMMALCLALACVSYFFDLWVHQNVSAGAVPGDIHKAMELSEFFAHGFGAAIVLISVGVLFPKLRRQLPRMVVCVFCCGMASHIGKSMVARRRPVTYDGAFPDSIQETWLGWIPIVQMREEFDYAIQSFPSGHTSTAYGLALALIWICPRGRWWFLTLAFLGGMQRITSQAHWPSDVFAGMALAFGLGTVILYSKPADQLFGKFEAGGEISRES